MTRRSKNLLRSLWFGLTASFFSQACYAESPAGDTEIVPAYSNLSFDSSVFLAAVPGNNRLAVVEQAGRIKVFADDENADSTTTVLDISDQIVFRGEQGLLGLAFDPDFEQNRLIYLNYSMARPRRNVISSMRWDAATDAVQVSTERIIIEIDQPFSNHNGGMLAFGSDGYLYIGVGDGGSGGDPKGHGQDTQTLLGNLLRLDVHPDNTDQPYAIPADNPFVDDVCCKPEIYSYGWRNPYRFSFDSETGELWVPDVGQNAIEEINKVVAGGNYGWNAYEGTLRYAKGVVIESNDLQQPVFEYEHNEGRSITGGYVYRGSTVPSLNGQYIYGDYASGKIWSLDLDYQGNTRNTLLGNVRGPTGFGETADGDVVIVTHNSGLYRFKQTKPQ